MWKTEDGTYLDALYQQVGEAADESEEALAPTSEVDAWEEMTP